MLLRASRSRSAFFCVSASMLFLLVLVGCVGSEGG
jgi:hypothetical protein